MDLNHRGKVAAFWRPVPCSDAIKSFTESAHYTVSSWWYGLRRQGLKSKTFPDGYVPEQSDDSVHR